jgi:hypothetical protein
MKDEINISTRQEGPNQWAEILEQLFEKLIGKNMAVTYKFDNLTFDLPRAEGPDGQHIGSAKWTINGKVIVTTEAYKKEMEER